MFVVEAGLVQPEAPVPGSTEGSRSKYRLKLMQPLMALHLAAQAFESSCG
jgi:hypothetical protein